MPPPDLTPDQRSARKKKQVAKVILWILGLAFLCTPPGWLAAFVLLIALGIEWVFYQFDGPEVMVARVERSAVRTAQIDTPLPTVTPPSQAPVVRPDPPAAAPSPKTLWDHLDDSDGEP